MPVVISFTVETDGRLPSGQLLAEAIEQVDRETDGVSAYFMINCAHPTHFLTTLDGPGPWHRIRGIRANASTMSHAELDNSEVLDDGDPADLAGGYLEIGERCRISSCSAAAAAPTTATSRASPTPGSRSGRGPSGAAPPGARVGRSPPRRPRPATLRSSPLLHQCEILDLRWMSPGSGSLRA